MRILVADDSRTILQLVKSVLEQKNHQVITAQDGFEAVEKIFFEKPELLILDVNMPKLNGYQLTRFIRYEEGLSKLPIIILTSQIASLNKYWGYKSGANYYLEKPFEPSKLLEKVEEISKKERVEIKPEDSVFGKKIYNLLQKIKLARKDPISLRLRENELALLLFSYLNERLDESLIKLNLIKEVSDLVSKTTDLNIFIKEILKKLSFIFDYNVGIIFLKSKHKSQLFIQCRTSLTEKFLEKCREKTLAICEEEEIYNQSDNLSVKIIEMDEFIYGNINEEIKFYRYFPFEIRGIKVGGLFLYSKVPMALYEENLSFLDIFCQQVSILIDNVMLVEKLKQYGDDKAVKLSAIYEIGRILSSSFDMTNFLNLVLDNVISVMKIKRASLLLINEDTWEITYHLAKGDGKYLLERKEKEKVKEQSISGWILKNKKPLLIEDIRKDPRFASFMREEYSTYSFISVPIVVKGKIEGILNVTDKNSGENFNIEDLDMMVLLATQIGKNIENTRLYQQLAEKERLDKELEIAHNIQMSWLPKESPSLEGLSVYGCCFPAKEMSGDYFDYLSYDEKSFSFVIGDVSGKGVPASLAVVMMRSALRMESSGEVEPSRLLSKLNLLLLEDMDPDMFATVFLGKFDIEKKLLYYANGGHEHPLIYKASLNQLFELEGSGMLLGMFPQAKYTLYQQQLEPGDFIFLYTDGVTDIVNRDNQKFGIANLKKMVLENADNPPQKLVENILNSLMLFKGNEKQFDDITMVCLRIDK